MNICVYSKTPLAAAPWELYKALRKYTPHKVCLINKRFRYSDGRYFPYHLLMTSTNGTASAALKNSAIWHVHNYLDQELRGLHKEQRVIAQFHSLPRQGNWAELMQFADISYTIKQPLHEKEYRLPGLPNIIDPDEYRPIRRPGKIRIAFAPSSKAPVGNLASKGYAEVQEILGNIAMERNVEIVWIEGKSYLTNLAMKQRSHILVDDVVTGNWHRTSLEGCCFGCAVLNRIKQSPFFYASLNSLRERLLRLIDNRSILEEVQERSRMWVLRHWHAMDKIKVYERAYKGVLNG